MFEVVAFWQKLRVKAAAFGLILAALLSLLVAALQTASAAPNWTLDPSASVLTYQSVKKNTIDQEHHRQAVILFDRLRRVR